MGERIEQKMFYGAKQGLFRLAVSLRKNMTRSELILWKKLKDRKLFNVKFRRQHPIDIFIVDFYCHECKLVIEVDGEIHFNRKNHDYDDVRSRELRKFGIKILRFSNYEVTFEMTGVINKIQKTITELSPLQGTIPQSGMGVLSSDSI